MKIRIQLGDKVKCKITGFAGIAVARTEFLNGCVQISVAPKWDGKSTFMENEGSIDEQSLTVIKRAKVEDDDEEDDDDYETGGPSRLGLKMRGF